MYFVSLEMKEVHLFEILEIEVLFYAHISSTDYGSLCLNHPNWLKEEVLTKTLEKRFLKITNKMILNFWSTQMINIKRWVDYNEQLPPFTLCFSKMFFN